jgi:hypothetical protein
VAPKSLSPEISALLPQIAQQPAAAADQLRALADTGDPHAIVLAAWALAQAGRWAEAIPYAERAGELGAVQIIGQYVGNMIGQPEHRDAALRMLRIGMAGGWQVDPLGWLPTFAQRGDAEGAATLIELATSGWPQTSGARADALVTRLSTAMKAFDDRIHEVDGAKRDAIEAIKTRESQVDAEVQRLADLGYKVETIAHAAASDELSRQYARQAKRNERSAFWFTVAAIVVGAGAAGIAAYFTLSHATDGPSVAEALTKAGIAIPVALFATFLGRLASRFRQMAWRWRHVELQLQTAEGYIAELDKDQRARLVETLALRFFPGQPLDISGSSGPESEGLVRTQA